MTLVIARGQAASTGETWTPTKQNNSTVPQITVDTQTLVGRNTVGNGSIEELLPAVARSILGLGSMALNSLSIITSTAINVNQTGAGTGVAMVFNALGAPTVNLTPGKWLLIGILTVRMSDIAGEAKLEFSDNVGSNTFGFGCSGALPTTRSNAVVVGTRVVSSGSIDIFFKGTPQAGSTLNLGSNSASAYAAGILAIKLEGP